jgi:hypothetical protein
MRNRQCLCCFARDLHTVELPLLLKRARFLSEPPQTSAFPCISAMCKTVRNSVLWPIEIVSNLGNTANKLCTV